MVIQITNKYGVKSNVVMADSVPKRTFTATYWGICQEYRKRGDAETKVEIKKTIQ